MSIADLGHSLTGFRFWSFVGFDPTGAPEETTIGDIADYFDKLYASPANRKIDWKYAYVLATLNARDDDENDRLSLLAFLREHDRLPTSGRVVAVKDAETLIIDDNGERFEVTIAGISVPPAVAEKTKAILQSLTKGAVLAENACSLAGPLPVDLVYWTEFFDDQKRLVATVKLPSYQVACIGMQQVGLNEENAEFTNLSFFLVGHGLAAAAPVADKLWTKGRRTIAESLATSEEGAKAAKLYMHGGAKDQKIEQLSGPSNSAL